MTDQIELLVTGMSCGSCAALIQDELSDLPGIATARVSFPEKRASVAYEPAQVTVPQLIEKITELGYQAAPVTENQAEGIVLND